MFLFKIITLCIFIYSPGKSIELNQLHEDHADNGLAGPYLFWPLQDTKTVKISKRDATSGPVGLSEGGQLTNIQKNTEIRTQVNQNNNHTSDSEKAPDPKNITQTTVAPHDKNNTNSNITITTKKQEEDPPKQGVVKRGFIVFGGFALLGIAYFIFYRRKQNKNENSNIHNVPESLQFRYGVLQNNERDNLELSRVPLTMESDEDDDDDDLEIFDLEQKKRHLSYTNLKTQDDETFSVVNDASLVLDNDRENLLLDIDDKNSDTLINLTGHSSK